MLGRDDLVVEALEEDHRRREAVEVLDRRALAVERLRLGPRADELIEVARLELVRVPGERARVGDAVVARAGHERVRGRQRLQRRVAAGARAADDRTVAVDAARRRQVLHAGDAVLDVGDAPLPAQRLAEGAAVARRAAVVDVGDREAARW